MNLLSLFLNYNYFLKYGIQQYLGIEIWHLQWLIKVYLNKNVFTRYFSLQNVLYSAYQVFFSWKLNAFILDWSNTLKWNVTFTYRDNKMSLYDVLLAKRKILLIKYFLNQRRGENDLYVTLYSEDGKHKLFPWKIIFTYHFYNFLNQKLQMLDKIMEDNSHCLGTKVEITDLVPCLFSLCPIPTFRHFFL